MKKICFLLAILIYCLPRGVYSQAVIPEFGKIDMADMLLKDCSFEKGADAMNLIDNENVRFEITQEGLYVDIEKWERVKIFTQAGFKYASVVIPYIRKDRLIKVIDVSAFAYTLDENGNVLVQKLAKNDIYKEESRKGTGSLRFTFPNIKPGSVIEYKYTLEEDNLPYLEPWVFQDAIPTRVSSCNLLYNSYVDIDIGVHASLPFSSTPDSVKALDGHYKKITQSFSMHDVPAFKAEPMMSSINDNLQRIVFSISPGSGNKPAHAAVPAETRWRSYNLELLTSRYFGLLFNEVIPGTGEKLDSIKKLPSGSEKIAAIYNWVKTEVKWDNIRDIFADDLATVWLNKTGGSAEINLLILNFLRKAGVQCYPVLISTKRHGRPDITFANLGQFNGVDVLALDSDQKYILDGTQKFQSYNVPPFNVQNSYGFIVDLSDDHWVYLDDPRELMKNIVNIKAVVDTSGAMNGRVSISYFDHARVDALNQQEEEAGSKGFLEQEFSLKIDSVKQENTDDPGKPLIRSFNFKMEMEQSGDLYFFDPFFLSSFKKNPFTDSTRRTDVDFGSKQYYAVNMNIALPPNIVITDLPPNKEIRLADSSFSFARLIAKQGDALIIRNHFEITDPVFPVEAYPFLKSLFEKMYALLNERIVFKRMN